MIAKNARVRYMDLADLRISILHMPVLDFYWMLGAPAANWNIKGKAGKDLIRSPALSLLVRALERHPPADVLPPMPSVRALYEKVAPLYLKLMNPHPKKGEPKETLSWRRFGLLFGVSQYSSHRWSTNEAPNRHVQRLMFLLDRWIDLYGVKGLEMYMGLVQEEIESRGFEGLEAVFVKGGWETRAAKGRGKRIKPRKRPSR